MKIKPQIYYVILLILFCKTEVFSQNKILKKIEKDCKCPEFDKSKYFSELLDINKSANEIELRLVQYSMVYTRYTMISYNKGKYNAVYYINKLMPVHTFKGEKKIRKKSPYFRYAIKNKDLESIMTKLLKDSVYNWVDPGIYNTSTTDLGIMIIYYKYGDITGSYRFQPPPALLRVQPNLEAFKRINRITNQLYSMTDSVRILSSKRKPIE